MAEGDPPQTPDLAVRAFIGLFVLGAVLHGFDVMKDGMQPAATWWVIGAGLAVFDWYWVRIKSCLGPRFAAKANEVATDFRWWAAALIAVFFIAGAADTLQRSLPMLWRTQSVVTARANIAWIDSVLRDFDDEAKQSEKANAANDKVSASQAEKKIQNIVKEVLGRSVLTETGTIEFDRLDINIIDLAKPDVLNAIRKKIVAERAKYQAILDQAAQQ